MNMSFVIIIGGVFLTAILVSIICVVYFKKTKKHSELMKKVQGFRQEIASDGIKADATVIAINHMETTQGGNTALDWVLSVALPGGETYELSEDQLECEKCFYINAAFAAYGGRKGAIIPLTVHPRHKELVQIDEYRLQKFAVG